jgi:putative transposase
MLTALVVLLRLVGLLCRGHRAVALENLALRQQLAALTRTVKRPQLRRRDRLSWILLAKGWGEWRTALMVVQPETVLRWHRQWLRRRWADRSKRLRPGRPGTDAAIRAMVHKMAAEKSAVGRASNPWRIA